MSDKLKFDFDFGDADSTELFDQTKKELLNLKASMGGEGKGEDDEDVRATEAYFAALQPGKIEFPRASPTVFPLNRAYFKRNRLPVPKNYDELSAQARFYWVEVPVQLIPGEKPFFKVQMGMEFGKGISDELVPKVHSAFPASKFAELASIKGGSDFGLSQNLEFEVATGIDKVALPTSVPIVDASAGGKLAVNAKLASDLGLVLGPYSYIVKRALVDCRPAGEGVIWTITDKQSLIEANPVFIVILRVPKEVTEVQMTARLQAHRAAPLPRFFVRVLDLILPNRAEWLKQGAPITPKPYTHKISTEQ